jgi:hypothetical protein
MRGEPFLLGRLLEWRKYGPRHISRLCRQPGMRIPVLGNRMVRGPPKAEHLVFSPTDPIARWSR